GKKIQVTRFLFEIFHTPRSPERLQFFFRKFFRRHLQFGFPVGEAASFSLVIPSEVEEFLDRTTIRRQHHAKHYFPTSNVPCDRSSPRRRSAAVRRRTHQIQTRLRRRARP